MKVFPVFKRQYGDFDVAYDGLMAVFDTPEAAQAYAAELNAGRSAEDIRYEVEHHVGSRVPYHGQPTVNQ